ncbi:uncharacterized protein LOC107267898 isoform X1 [Cephus cinctus]|uniref:Uncharacterized protein LOC107267898 isoform X1 n=1 Tax=Cephus cinctus TaxID=211228 RepID=A0AAJ7BVP3_CEPCN|nr:uncharacterized protein LOC107267898 isoform X1 [Cephus cinctus]
MVQILELSIALTGLRGGGTDSMKVSSRCCMVCAEPVNFNNIISPPVHIGKPRTAQVHSKIRPDYFSIYCRNTEGFFGLFIRHLITMDSLMGWDPDKLNLKSDGSAARRANASVKKIEALLQYLNFLISLELAT